MKLTKIVTTSLVLLTAALALSACKPKDKQTLSNEKVYNVATNANFPPFESTNSNGDIVGFDIDLMNAMAKAGHFKVTYKNQPWDGLFQSLTTGDNDILVGAITITDERKMAMAFTDPYFKITQVILVPKGQNVKSINDLKNLQKVGVTTGTTGDIAAQKVLGATSSKIARFENLPLTIKDLEDGGVQALISDSAVVASYIKNNSDEGFTMVEVPDFTKEEYGIAVRKDDPALLKTLNDALAKVRASGEYDKIYQKYFDK